MSSSDAPLFTVVMATFGRGAHILPSVRSVLAQGDISFELLVIGDACPAETGAAVASLGDPRARWINLDSRVGSQSGPNNAGIAAARGRYIAYLGHDDLWEPSHLAALYRLFAADVDLDFAVSGCIYHWPHDQPGSLVTGLFDADDAAFHHFFPPSSFAHKREACERIGPWLPPYEIQAPVDADFTLRAARAGLRFASTGRVTAHKFAAGQRYLSYLRQTSDEQARMLPWLGTPELAARVDALVEDARRLKRFMIAGHADYSALRPGALARANAERKGLERPALRPLGQGLVLPPRDGFYALDWHEKPHVGLLWTYESPRPKILLPVTGEGPAWLFLVAAHRAEAALASLAVNQEDAPVEVRRITDLPPVSGIARALFCLRVRLAADEPAILELRLTAEQAPVINQVGLAIGDLYLVPAEPDAADMDALISRARARADHLPPADQASSAIP